MRLISRAGTLLLVLIAVPPATAAPDPPPWLPRYDLSVVVDVAGHRATVRERVAWTNRHARPTDELVFSFYPRYKVPDADSLLLAKTVEILRVAPKDSVLEPGQHGDVVKATWAGKETPGVVPAAAVPSSEVKFAFQEANQTALTVKLPSPVAQGETVTVELEFTIDLPAKQGRWGQWGEVTYLANSFPVLAFYDDAGWQPMPFIPWHQPFFNEAGIYRATITLPADQVLSCSAPTAAEQDLGNGWKRVQTQPMVSRDFTVLCSRKYQPYTAEVEDRPGHKVTLRCFAFPEHEFYAREILRIASDALPIYNRWFGPYPYEHLSFAEAFFGWNGNECGGLIMVDERVFAMPQVATRYVEYLISHEVSHQWWYNVVGTNGYAETFMDEALATHFTHKLLDERRGKDNTIVGYSGSLGWLPDIRRENYRNGSVYGAIRRGDAGPAVQEIPKYGHVIGLFNGAYDRGSKVVDLIEDRLGNAAFLDFMRGIQKKYAWQILRVADYQRELEAYTGRPWGEFFQQWVYGTGLTDWSVERVDVDESKSPAVATVGLPGDKKTYTVMLRQRREIDEPTVLGVRLDDSENYQIRVPIVPAAGVVRTEDPPALIEPLDDHRVRVTVALPSKPTQVTVDPDNVLLDAEPDNNCWKTRIRWRFTPLYTLLDETDLTADYDKWNVTCGPWLFGSPYADPWYTRSTMAGLRVGAFRTQEFVGGFFGAYRTDFRDLVIGADALIDHWPDGHMQVGGNFERRVAGPFGADGPSDGNRGSLFARYVFTYGSSLYLPPIHFVEAFGAYADNIFPFARTTVPGAIRPSWTATTGLHYRLDLLTPYWDPEHGFRMDLTYAGGVANLAGDTADTHQVTADFRVTQRLPGWTGWFSDSRVAARIYGAAAMPGRGEFFALGGGTLFRGFDLAERQGSAMWVGSVEWRLPLLRQMEIDGPDHVAGLRNVSMVGFYDVGQIFDHGHSVGNVAHALGVGLRLDVALFSFIERTTFRIDVGKAVSDATPWQVWFGMQQPF